MKEEMYGSGVMLQSRFFWLSFNWRNVMMKKHTTMNVRALTLIAVLGTLSAVLMSISVPLPFAPPFLKFDIAEFPGLFAGFFWGPGAGACVILIKNLLKLLLKGTETMYVGELMNVVGSLAYTLPAALIYKYNKTMKGVGISLTTATIIGSALAILLNLFIAFPMFAHVYGISLDAIIDMGSSINPFINNMFSLILFGVVPFNLIKLSLTSLATWWIYKRVGKQLHPLIQISEDRKGVKYYENII